MDVPPTTRQRSSSTGLLLGLGAAVLVLCVVFGVTTLKSRAQYSEYKASTIDAGPLPWEQQPHSVQDCVDYSIDWAMECPGVASWCGNEAPLLTRRCMESQDRTAYCEEQGQEVSSTRFGYEQCEAMRESVEGRYTKRAHKKHCAASFRAVASWCREIETK